MGSGHKGHGHGDGLSRGHGHGQDLGHGDGHERAQDLGHDDHDRGREHDPGRGGARKATCSCRCVSAPRVQAARERPVRSVGDPVGVCREGPVRCPYGDGALN